MSSVLKKFCFISIISLLFILFTIPIDAKSLICKYDTFKNRCAIQFDEICPPLTHPEKECPFNCNGPTEIQCISDTIPTPPSTPTPTDCSSLNGSCQPRSAGCLGETTNASQCSPQIDSTNSSYVCCLPKKDNFPPPINITNDTPISTNDVDAVPDPKVPCWDESSKGWEDPEFHSLRPYQASPCQDAPKAYLCSNNITVKLAHVEVDYDGHEWEDYNGGEETKTVVIDLSEVDLPILGNTQLTANSQKPIDLIDDPTKMNEYLSWYLAGTNQKAEYGVDSPDKTVNFSGPVKKLAPSVILEFMRFRTLHDAGVKEEITDDETLVETKETFNHNQIVVCTTKNFFGISNPFLGEEVPRPCYEGENNLHKDKEYRLLKWWEGKETGFIESLKVIDGWDGSKRWDSTIPPFPWQFEKDVFYKKAYQEWRGKECFFPFAIFKNYLLICADFKIPGIAELHTNPFADFYQYIPLSNTTDKKGSEVYNHVAVRSPSQDAILSKSDYEIISFPKLYFPHTIETATTLKDLNRTFLPQDGVNNKEIPSSTETNPLGCKIINARTNPGDDLTFKNTSTKHQIVFKATYKVDKIRCKDTGKKKSPGLNPLGIPLPPEPVFDCSSDIYAQISLVTKSPYLNEIWKDSVGGAGSTFRRIFPKIEDGSPVTCIADIPASSNATYILNNKESSENVELLKVENPGGSVAPNPEIYFPHLGSVYEYFLNGIQTALRPKGYGSPIANGNLCTSSLDSGDCSFSMEKVNKGISNASKKYNVPEELLRGIFEIESLPYIANPDSYQCTQENGAGAIGVGQFKKETADFLTCGDEKMDNDIGMCGDYDGKLSRCNIVDSFELMARYLLLLSGKLNNCNATGSMSMDNKEEWWKAACQYGTGFNANTITINYQNSIPTNERPVGRNMNYCDVLCHKLGRCPSYPSLSSPQQPSSNQNVIPN